MVSGIREDDVIVSLDQAKNCGWCVSKGDTVIDYGVFVSEQADYHDVAFEVKNMLMELCNKYKPILITVEDIHGGLNADTSKKLGILQGVLVNYAIQNKILFSILKPATWQGKNGLNFDKTKTRKYDTKTQSKMFACEYLGVEKINENTADAVCMNYYARKNIKIVAKAIDK